MRIRPERLDPSIREVADRLRDDYAGVPLVALGQTAFWDEPTKAALFCVLETLNPGCHRFRVGVNDHDYFSKTAAPLPTHEPFAILEHNDGSTRDLWVATGELSMLFGSETIPTRDLLREHGVELEKVAREAPEGREALIDRVTAAWGWRGIVQTGERRQIAHEVLLADIVPYLAELLCWGLCDSAALVHDNDASQAAFAFADDLIAWVRQFDREHPGALLSDAYRAAHVRFYERLTGRRADGLETFTSTRAFRFTVERSSLPRFRILDVFLQPTSRDIARRAYDAAVEGSQTYTLDRFGPGAIPFDLVVPGRGRGTVRVLPDGVAVATAEPIWLPTEGTVESAADLARVVERHLGPNTALVGKGHTFVCMVTAESVLVFHEGGSSYVHRTARVVHRLAEEGVPLPLYPILRVRHHTWDSLSDTGVCLRLPPHLAEAFHTERICGAELARRWRGVVAEQKHLLEDLAALGGTRELVAFLSRVEGGEWSVRLEQYQQAHERLIRIHERSREFEARSQDLYEELKQAKLEAQRLEAEKGEDYRRNIKPLRERLWELAQAGVTSGPEVERIQAEIAAREAPRAEMDRAIAACRKRVRQLEQETKAIRKARIESEKGPEAAAARKAIANIERHAELARLELVRRALLVTRGLPQSNLRPSAWWFPLVDPTGRWFENLAHSMELYFEPLSPVEPKDA